LEYLLPAFPGLKFYEELLMMKLKMLFISMLSVVISSGCATSHKNIPVYPNLSEHIEQAQAQQKQLAQQEEQAAKAYQQALVKKYNESALVMSEAIGMKVRVLGDKEAILAAVSQYEQTGNIEPIVTHDNVVMYPFALSKAKMICATVRVCSIELQEGEIIKDVMTGDSERWNISFANSGVLSNQKPHVMVKPLFEGSLKTNLIITTERRVYNIELSSIGNGVYTPRIAFFYPQETRNVKIYSLDNKNTSKFENQSNNTVIAETAVSVSALNFKYQAKGNKKSPWFPQRIFDDGKKVFIQMSERVDTSEAPVFLIVGDEGKQEIVNYRFKSPYYVVDKLFTKGILILGTDKKQTIITIVKK